MSNNAFVIWLLVIFTCWGFLYCDVPDMHGAIKSRITCEEAEK